MTVAAVNRSTVWRTMQRDVCTDGGRLQATRTHTACTGKMHNVTAGEMVVRTRTVTVLPRMHIARKVILGSLDGDADATRVCSPRPRPRLCLPLFILDLFDSTSMLECCYRLGCACTERPRIQDAGNHRGKRHETTNSSIMISQVLTSGDLACLKACKT
jgi:hypothetical protein